jgi:hypothetical protein
MFRINKLDRRYNGSKYYSYVASISGFTFKDRNNSLIFFSAVREWCIETWGLSAELDIQTIKLRFGSSSIDTWCWMSDFSNDKFRIYLKSSAEVTLFKLKWC